MSTSRPRKQARVRLCRRVIAVTVCCLLSIVGVAPAASAYTWNPPSWWYEAAEFVHEYNPSADCETPTKLQQSSTNTLAWILLAIKCSGYGDVASNGLREGASCQGVAQESPTARYVYFCTVLTIVDGELRGCTRNVSDSREDSGWVGGRSSTNLRACLGLGVPCVELAPSFAFRADPSTGFRDRTVEFEVTPGSSGRDVRYELSLGDGTAPRELLPGVGTDVEYGKPGEFTPFVLATDVISGCTSTRSRPVVADPVTTYAPAIMLQAQERYYPDRVNGFLSAAVLVRDVPNYEGWPLSMGTCRDKALAKGPEADLTAFRAARAGTEVPTSVPPLAWSGLAGTTTPYVAERFQMKLAPTAWGHVLRKGCEPTGETYTSADSYADKAGFSDTLDDGMVLSMAGAPDSVLEGDHSLDRARLYVSYEPGRYITYWIFYPHNVWESSTGGLDEIHEGDWEHITVRLGGEHNRMNQVAYFQHACAPDIRARGELTLQEETHPPVWPALGGHSSYHAPHGVHHAGTCLNPPQGMTDITHEAGAQTWRTWESSSSGENPLVRASDQPWYGYKGAWGDPRKSSVMTYGPRAPGAQDHAPEGW